MSFLFRRAPERRRRACRSVAPQIAKERAARLREKGDAALRAISTRRSARRLRLLTERGGTARAADFTLARTPGVEAGLMIDALVPGHDGRALATRGSWLLVSDPVDRAVLIVRDEQRAVGKFRDVDWPTEIVSGTDVPAFGEWRARGRSGKA